MGRRSRSRERQWSEVSDDSRVENCWLDCYNQIRESDGLPWYYMVGGLLALLMMFHVVGFLGSNLPTPLTFQDDTLQPGRFIADQAGRRLLELTSFGPRPVGSYENEVLAPDLLVQEVGVIARQAHRRQQVTLDVQRVTGSYQLKYLDKLTFANSYRDVVNIVARLHSVKSNSNSSLLINCHFDTVPNSPGASDDALNCAVMLEVLRVLSQRRSQLPNDVIFLFNGAGSMLKASHGFVTQHKWAKTVKAFVNLESFGVGGREMLFRAGPQHAWLVELYASSVPYPHGQILAEDLYKDNPMPSDTDFRIFRDFGHIPGLDFAHAMNGYVYHTRFDRVELIPPGALQHTGANLLALTKAVASSPLLSHMDEHSAANVPIYYDIIGLFMVCYSKRVAFVINMLTGTTSLYADYLSVRSAMPDARTRDRLFWTAMNGFLVTFGWGLGYMAAGIVNNCLVNSLQVLTWFTNTGLLFGLYYVPTLMFMALPLLIQDLCNMQYLERPVAQVQVNCCATQLVWTILLLLTTLCGSRSAYVFFVMTVCPTIASLLMNATFVNKPASTWLLCYALSTLIPLPYLMYLTQLEFGVFIPIMARLGPQRHPEEVISSLASLTCIMMFCYLVPLVVLVKERFKIQVGLGVLFSLTLALTFCSPISFPFSDNPKHPTPQRVAILHTDQVVMNMKGEATSNSSGYWLLPFDPLGTSTYRDYVPEMDTAIRMPQKCNSRMLCGLPVYWSNTVNMLLKSVWIPAAPPVIRSPATLQLEKRKMISSDTVRLALTAKGVDNMVVYLVPMANVFLVAWSFSPGKPSPITYWWADRPAYFIHHSSGSANLTLHFHLDFKVRNANDPIVDIAIAGHYFNDKNSTSEEFKAFVGQFPWWVAVTSWTATIKLYQY